MSSICFVLSSSTAAWSLAMGWLLIATRRHGSNLTQGCSMVRHVGRVLNGRSSRWISAALRRACLTQTRVVAVSILVALSFTSNNLSRNLRASWSLRFCNILRRSLNYESIVVDVDIRCCVYVQNSTLASMACMSCHSVGGHNICVVPAFVLTIATWHPFHKLIHILHIWKVGLSFTWLSMSVLPKSLYTICALHLLC